METVRLGRTGLIVTKNGFGALPIQRVSMEEAVRILRKAYDNGINYFDTAHTYSDSEEKLGNALHHVRENIIISTKAMTTTVEGFWSQLHESLVRYNMWWNLWCGARCNTAIAKVAKYEPHYQPHKQT